jgi:hypothetical protein
VGVSLIWRVNAEFLISVKFAENIGRRLNDEGVPVVAIPLLSFDEGYYFTADNFLRAADATRSGRRGPMSSVRPGMVSVLTSSPMFAYISSPSDL